MTRHDNTPEQVARRWLAGESVLDLAVELMTDEELIKRRIRKARREFPGLPWDRRPEKQTRSSTLDYRSMNDGIPGESVLREGSVVRGNGRSRRGSG